MKIALFIGNGANHIALAGKLAKHAGITAIIVEDKTSGAARKTSLPARILNKLKLLSTIDLDRVWHRMMDHYRQEYSLPEGVPVCKVDNINGEAAAAYVAEIKPDIIVVSGTRMIKQKLIEAVSQHAKILNLHTGLSPYIKGGPNCTNWCLAEGKPDYIGNTIMWLDKGIDTGNIIATELVPLTGIKDLYSLHLRVMEHAHDLYIRAIKAILGGRQLPSVPQQSIAAGKTYYTKEWTPEKRKLALRNFKKHFPVQKEYITEDIKLVYIA